MDWRRRRARSCSFLRCDDAPSIGCAGRCSGAAARSPFSCSRCADPVHLKATCRRVLGPIGPRVGGSPSSLRRLETGCQPRPKSRRAVRGDKGAKAANLVLRRARQRRGAKEGGATAAGWPPPHRASRWRRPTLVEARPEREPHLRVGFALSCQAKGQSSRAETRHCKAEASRSTTVTVGLRIPRSTPET
jgi:hypothetical protein